MHNSLFWCWWIQVNSWGFVRSDWFSSGFFNFNRLSFWFFIGSQILNDVFLFFFDVLTHWRFGCSCSCLYLQRLQWLMNSRWLLRCTFLIDQLITQLYINRLIRTCWLLTGVLLCFIFFIFIAGFIWFEIIFEVFIVVIAFFVFIVVV